MYPISATDTLIKICEEWHGGQASAMYSVLSTHCIRNENVLMDLVIELRECSREADNRESEIGLLAWSEALEMFISED